MHLNLEDLLAVRDGEATSQAADHAASCPECAARIERLRDLQRELAALPDERPAQDLWPALRAELDARRQRRRFALAGWAAACLAAAFTLVIGIRGGIEAWHEAGLSRQTRELVGESQRLEQQLRINATGSHVVSGRTAGTIVQLQDRIALIDAQLARTGPDRAASQDLVKLWQERVRLLDALVNVQTTRTAYIGL
jgi:predicted anti-sigma-YlaC factor YlaD